MLWLTTLARRKGYGETPLGGTTLSEQQERRSLKYIRLAAHLAAQPASVERIEMTLPEIEQVVGETLPSGSRFPSWWRNDERKMHSRAWLTAGWRVARMGDGGASVEFTRVQETEAAE